MDDKLSIYDDPEAMEAISLLMDRGYSVDAICRVFKLLDKSNTIEGEVCNG